MKTKMLSWSISSVLFAAFILAGGEVQLRRARASLLPKDPCPPARLALDVDGDGHDEEIRLVRVGDTAWADVWAHGQVRSTTRLGAWHDHERLAAVDANHDGKSDLLRRWNEGPSEHTELWLSDGVALTAGWSAVTGGRCVARR